MTTHYIFFLILQLLLMSIYINASPNRQLSKELISSITPKSNPSWVDEYCTKDADCKIDECCVFKPDRYSIPKCQKYGKDNDPCIPFSSPWNLTLYYPDDSKIELLNAHRIFCPCSENFTCKTDTMCHSNNITKGPSVLINN